MPLLSYGVVGGCSVGVLGQVCDSVITFESDFYVGVLEDLSNFPDLG
jgi:hypothetical protein